ncbi:MAG: cupredoxin family copper-binding protein [Gemmatimonadales bacterium]|nr:cupredoxin family copper-binding protein [Gemmatimonadales bacterium]
MRLLPLSVVAALGCFSGREPAGPADQRCGVPLTDDVPGSTLSAIVGFAFQPAELRVPVGQRITWVNCEDNGAPHTSTADAGEWNSALLQPGDGFTRNFPEPGTFTYFCEVHPFMTGRVVVE